jgi:hypothetical protein
MPVLQQDVARLDIAVHDPLSVREVQRVPDFGGDPDRLLERQRAFPLEALAQRLALHVRHYVVEKPPGVTGVVEGKNVWVGETGGERDLPKEPVGPERGGELGAEDLDGDRP